MSSFKPLLVATALLVAAGWLPSPAAAGSPFYVTAKLGNTSLDARLNDSFEQLLDGDDNSWAAGLGFQLGRWVAFQLEYHDLGTVPGLGAACPVTAPVCIAALVPVEADTSALSLSALPQVRLTERVVLYGKLGVVSWASDIDELADGAGRFRDEFEEEDAVVGAGLRLRLPGPLGVYAEYERIGDLFDTVAVGATLGF